jgi:preprotein translocase subunit SecG
LNAWIGGFESILSKMTAGNFNWFLHVMLFMHTVKVIQRQQEKMMESEEEEEEEQNDTDVENE